MFRLDGKVALISGASRGLGWGMAKSLAQQGATVCLNGRDSKTLIARSNELKEQGFQAEVVPFDVSDTDERDRAIDALLKRLGKIDVLIANAGIQHRSEIENFSDADFQKVIETNLTGVWALAKSVTPSMRTNQSGRIIFTGSITASLGRATISAYIASKGGVHALARQLAVELGSSGVTVNVIAPGYFATEMNQALMSDKNFNEWVCGRVPLARWGTVDEIGAAAVFLSSDEAAYVNGHVLTVDGGFSIAM